MIKTILVADDDLSVQQSLARVLESEGYEVLLASNGTQAIQQAIAHQPNLALLDITMPNRDGWEAFESLERFCPLMPVVIITARPNQYPRAVGNGIDALMEKPLDLPLLLHTIARLLAESQRDRIRRLTRGDFQTEFLRNSPS